MKRIQVFTIIAAALLGGLVAVFGYSAIIDNTEQTVFRQVQDPVSRVNYISSSDSVFDFTFAAENTVHAVVHVTSEATVQYRNPIYEFFYGDRNNNQQQSVTAYGSGVIVTDDGYIVTNNHVIENTRSVTVVLNDRRQYEAEVVGTDPTTDIALLKVEAENLPKVPFGNSDEVRLGEWVLAVGNPFNINSTVTAGIVSAIGRSGVGVLDDDYSIEAFIQTDAAVNRGNSGGALVNLRGEMIGVTTAIASPSGGNVGISFAVPTSIVEKVVTDLIEYGSVQRAIMGVNIDEVDAEIARENNLDNLQGVFITGVNSGSAADEAGIEPGDVITAIDGVAVNNTGSLQDLVARHRPGDEISVTVKRNNKTQQIDVVLRNLQGSTNVVRADTEAFNNRLGVNLGNLSDQERRKLGISNGVKVVELRDGILSSEGVREGFIITNVNKEPVNSVEELNEVINSLQGGVLIEGVYPDGTTAYYAFGL